MAKSWTIINCQVCFFETEKRRRHGALVCESCRRFYLRYRDQRAKIVCTSGDRQCLKRAERRFQENPCFFATKQGYSRALCHACRLGKCLELGMRSPNKEKTYSRQSNIGSPEPSCSKRYPDEDVMRDIEMAIQAIAERGSGYLSDQAKLPMRAEYFPDNNSDLQLSEFFVGVLGDTQAQNVAKFCRCLPGYSEFAMQDRCTLYTFGFSSLIIAENCYRSAEPYLLSVNAHNFSKLLTVLPELQYVEGEHRGVHEILQCWNPTDMEFYFLLALLLCDVRRESLFKNPQQIREGRESILRLLEAYLNKTFNGKSSVISKRISWIEQIQFIIQEANERRMIAFTSFVSRVAQRGLPNDSFFMNIVHNYERMRSAHGQQ